MSDYTGSQERETPTTLQDRVQVLEVCVAALTEALETMARGLEDLPTAEPGGRPAAEAARKAHELLLAAKSRQEIRDPL